MLHRRQAGEYATTATPQASTTSTFTQSTADSSVSPSSSTKGVSMPPSVAPPGQQVPGKKMKISAGMYRGDGPSTTAESLSSPNGAEGVSPSSSIGTEASPSPTR